MDTEAIDSLSVPGQSAAKTTFWQQHVDAWRDSTLTQRGYAKQHGLAVARFVYWKNKLHPNPRAKVKPFVSVRVTAPQHAIRLIHPNGFVIECSAGTDVGWLRSLMGLTGAS